MCKLNWVYVKLVAAMVLWGGTFVAGKIVVQSMGIWSGAFLRFAIAAVCLCLISYFQTPVAVAVTERSSVGMRKGVGAGYAVPRGRQWAWIGLMGLTGVFLYSALFLLGLQQVPASRAALIVATNPIAVAIGAALFLGERL
ncbi:MAG: DMT family transporter, partial [Synechococcales bacterium]|nr:DMT family transporter [Synechococcales bacterium]